MVFINQGALVRQVECFKYYDWAKLWHSTILRVRGLDYEYGWNGLGDLDQAKSPMEKLDTELPPQKQLSIQLINAVWFGHPMRMPDYIWPIRCLVFSQKHSREERPRRSWDDDKSTLKGKYILTNKCKHNKGKRKY